ncbi:MAG TPA: phospho-sugar mutase [Oscillospiraceae bacterium]|nr:phospho-sugar mutase [Oscillospiraceae bacterium]
MSKIEKWELRYNEWLKQSETDGELKKELLDIPKNEISDAFYKELEFGTGGLRSVMGIGTNRLNKYTVIRASKGVAAYLKGKSAFPSCAIAYDSRLNSAAFAKFAAAALAKEGVKVFIFANLRPTPMLSFAVRHLKADAGIVITASHNPSQYNGFKVYSDDGGQITTKAAEDIANLIALEPYFSDESFDFDYFLSNKSIEFINESVDNAFYDAVMKTSLYKPKKPLKIAFTPLNGAGLLPVLSILKRMGSTEVFTVPEQKEPDGNFPTCKSPNPELPEALELVIGLFKEKNADIAIATDPDADRIGVASSSDSDIKIFTGNEIGLILFDFICKIKTENQTMPKNPIAIKSIVTTELAVKIAKKYAVSLTNVLTGFKYIGEKITALKNESERFIFGFEESCGYLAGDYIRDKDAIGAALLVAEAASYYKDKGLSLYDALLNIYEEFGFEKTALIDFSYTGEKGSRTIKTIMEHFRNGSAEFLSEKPIVITDYLDDSTDLPKSNTISYKTPNTSVIIRPSGTEPKLKIYLTASFSTEKESNTEISRLKTALEGQIKLAENLTF